jgi:hypothetical protein
MPMILPEQHHAAWLGETDDGAGNAGQAPKRKPPQPSYLVFALYAFFHL